MILEASAARTEVHATVFERVRRPWRVEALA
jgi:hypothetical protein